MYGGKAQLLGSKESCGLLPRLNPYHVLNILIAGFTCDDHPKATHYENVNHVKVNQQLINDNPMLQYFFEDKQTSLKT